jgi:putative FmdB family regulatory protein
MYEYRCQSCETIVEAIQSFSAPPLTRCDSCGGDLRKLISRSAFHLKGAGWYSDRYGLKPSGKDDSKAGVSTGSSGTGEAKAEPPKTEAKSGAEKAEAKSGAEGSRASGNTSAAA